MVTYPLTASNVLVAIVLGLLGILIAIELVRWISDRLRVHYTRPSPYAHHAPAPPDPGPGPVRHRQPQYMQ
jgi:hypothetical protein